MLRPEYLNGLNGDPAENLPGWVAFRHHTKPGSWRYICAYQDGEAQKEKFFKLLSRHGQKEDRSGWDLHHILEGRHFSLIDFWGEYEAAYQLELPCILLHKTEHSLYTRLASISATKELYMPELVGASVNRAKQTAQKFSEAKTTESVSERKKILKELGDRFPGLYEFYRSSYEGDPLMQRIALNALSVAERKLTRL